MTKKKLLLILILFLSISVFSQNEDFSLWNSGQTFIFNSTGHIKSKGLNMSIKFPSNWSAAEGNRPNVLQKFFRNNKSDVQSLIIIKKFEKVLSHQEIAELKSTKELKAIIPKGGIYKNSNTNLILDGEPAFSLEYVIERKADNSIVGMNIIGYSLVYSIIYKDYLIQISFFVSNDSRDLNSDLESKYEKFKIAFKQIVNSLIILSKWE